MSDPCQDEEDKVEVINDEIQALQAELDGATTSEKPAIIAKIKEAQTELSAAKRALDACKRAHQPLVTTWSGDFLVIGKKGESKYPIDGNFSVGLTFSEDRSTFQMAALELDGNIEGIAISVTILAPNSGVVGAPDANGFRDMEIDVNVVANAAGQSRTIQLALNTWATLSMTDNIGEPITGSKMNGHGWVAMVGEGTSEGDLIDIELQGPIAPIPWDIGHASPATACRPARNAKRSRSA